MSHRWKVLSAFRNLHRARKEVFAGDDNALKEVQQRINAGFRDKLGETDSSKIEESLTLAKDVAYLLRSTVVQLQQKDSDTFEVRITENTILPENNLFDPAKEIPANPRKKKCSDYVKTS